MMYEYCQVKNLTTNLREFLPPLLDYVGTKIK